MTHTMRTVRIRNGSYAARGSRRVFGLRPNDTIITSDGTRFAVVAVSGTSLTLRDQAGIVVYTNTAHVAMQCGCIFAADTQRCTGSSARPWRKDGRRTKPPTSTDDDRPDWHVGCEGIVDTSGNRIDVDDVDLWLDEVVRQAPYTPPLDLGVVRTPVDVTDTGYHGASTSAPVVQRRGVAPAGHVVDTTADDSAVLYEDNDGLHQRPYHPEEQSVDTTPTSNIVGRIADQPRKGWVTAVTLFGAISRAQDACDIGEREAKQARSRVGISGAKLRDHGGDPLVVLHVDRKRSSALVYDDREGVVYRRPWGDRESVYLRAPRPRKHVFVDTSDGDNWRAA